MKILTYGALIAENSSLQKKLERVQVTNDWLLSLTKAQEKVINQLKQLNKSNAIPMKITHPDVYYCERNHFKCRILHSRYSWAKTSNKSLHKVKSCSSEIDTDLIPRQVETFDKFLDRKCTPSLHRSPTTTEEVCIKKFSKLIDSLQNKYGKTTSSSHRVMVASLDTIFVDIPPFEDAGHVQSFSSCRYCLRHRTRTVFLPNPPLPLPLRSVDPSGTSRATVPNMSL